MGFDKFDYEHRFLPKAFRDKLRKEQVPIKPKTQTHAQALYKSICKIY